MIYIIGFIKAFYMFLRYTPSSTTNNMYYHLCIGKVIHNAIRYAHCFAMSDWNYVNGRKDESMEDMQIAFLIQSEYLDKAWEVINAKQ